MSALGQRLLGWVTWRGVRLYLRRRFQGSGKRVGVVALALVAAVIALGVVSQRRIARAR